MMGFKSLFSLLCVLSVAYAASDLESYNVDTSSITVSGLSSGGAMAMQFHVAFSDIIVGSGIFAGLPHGCAKGGLTAATLCMTNPGGQVTATLIANIDSLASASSIDPTQNLNGDKVFIFHGTKDTTVFPAAGPKIRDIYEHYGSNVLTKFDLGAVHGFPTDFYGAACGSASSGTQYINNCDYHGAYEMLNYLHGGNLEKPTARVPLNGLLSEFDQTEFGASSLVSMDSVGYVYVPSACTDRANRCKFHISLHGCSQSRTTINDIYAKNTGYLEVAELNNIIVIFPQTAPAMLIGNPNACWDWWGYLNANFLSKNGAQMKAIRAMIERVAFCDGASDCYEDVVTVSPPTTTVPGDQTTPGGGSDSCEPNTVSFHPFPGSCDYYTLCACGAQVLLQCAPGLYFDTKINSCNFIQLVECVPDKSLNQKSSFFYNSK